MKSKILLLEDDLNLSDTVCEYLEEKGFEVWKARQEKWIKNYRKRSYSMVSQKLFWDIQDLLNLSVDELYFATFDKGVQTETNL